MRNLIGQQIGPYKIEELIGAGGMAEVYRAHQANLDRYVAIKVLKTSLADDPEFVARFSREALASGGLHHPNILRIYDAGTFEDRHYIVMDYASDGTLAQLAAKGPLTIDEAAAIGIQLADALDYAHRRPRPVIHRDLKPSNILLEDGRPLLADFGIAYLASTDARLTQTGTSLGTPEYMSPEQSEGFPVDGRTDIYSLGVILYQLVTGRVPFQGNTPIATMHQVVYTPPPSPHQFKDDVPDWMESIILRALAKRPADRFATAGEMAEALRKHTVVPFAASGEADIEQAAATQVIRHTKKLTPVTVDRQTVEGGGRSRIPLVVLPFVVILVLLGGAIFLVIPALRGRADGKQQIVRNPTLPPIGSTASPALLAVGPATPAQEAEIAAILARPSGGGGPALGASAPAGVVAPTETSTSIVLPAINTPQPTITTPTTVPSPTNTQVPATNTPITPTNTPETPTSTPVRPTATRVAPTSTRVQPTNTPLAPATKAAASGAPGTVMDFETLGAWPVGDQHYGTLTQSSDQVHTGYYSAKLAYDFPVVDQEYVVFQNRSGLGLALPGRPAALTIWVYGDGSGHYLNIWVKDYAGQVRQFTFGRVSHQGWKQMTALLDTTAPWPQGNVSGPASDTLVYPLDLEALVLDAVPHNAGPFKGAIYLDDLAVPGETHAQMAQPPSAPAGNGAPGATATSKP